MKKTYQKPTLVRRENLVQIAAQINQNGNLAIFSPVGRDLIPDESNA